MFLLVSVFVFRRAAGFSDGGSKPEPIIGAWGVSWGVLQEVLILIRLVHCLSVALFVVFL